MVSRIGLSSIRSTARSAAPSTRTSNPFAVGLADAVQPEECRQIELLSRDCGGDIVAFRQQAVDLQMGASKQRTLTEGLGALLTGQAEILNLKEILRETEVVRQSSGALTLEIGDDLHTDDITYAGLQGLAPGVAFHTEAQDLSGDGVARAVPTLSVTTQRENFIRQTTHLLWVVGGCWQTDALGGGADPGKPVSLPPQLR